MFNNKDLYKSLENNKWKSITKVDKDKYALLSNDFKKRTNFTNKIDIIQDPDCNEINEEEFKNKYLNNSDYNIIKNTNNWKDTFIIEDEQDDTIVNKLKRINKPDNIKIKYVDKIIECFVEEKILVFKKVQVPVKILKIKPVENVIEVHKNISLDSKIPYEVDYREVDKLKGNYNILPLKVKYRNIRVNQEKPIINEEIEIREIPVRKTFHKIKNSNNESIIKSHKKLDTENVIKKLDSDRKMKKLDSEKVIKKFDENNNSIFKSNKNYENNNNYESYNNLRNEFKSIQNMNKYNSKNYINEKNNENLNKINLNNINENFNKFYKKINFNINNNQDIKENIINNIIVYEKGVENENKVFFKNENNINEVEINEYKIKNIYDKKQVIKDKPKIIKDYVKNDIIIEELKKNIVKDKVEINKYEKKKIPKKTIKYVKNIEEESIELPVDNYIQDNEEKLIYRYNFIDVEESDKEKEDNIKYVKIKKEVPKIKYVDKILEEDLIIKKETEKIIYENKIVPKIIEKNIDIENIIYEPKIVKNKIYKKKYIKVPIKNKEIEKYTNEYIQQVKKNQELLKEFKIKKLELESKLEYLKNNELYSSNVQSKISFESQNKILKSTIATLRDSVMKKRHEIKNIN